MPYQENKRKFFQNFSVKLGILFSKIPLTPNQWTLISLLPAVVAVYYLTKNQFIEAGALFFVALFIDWIDGSVARVVGQASAKGAYIDTIVDRYVETIVIFGLLFCTLPNFFVPIQAWILLMLFGFFMTTYAKAASSEKKVMSEEHTGSFLNRAERTIILDAGILIAVLEPIYLTYVIAALAVLTNLAAIQRIYIALKTYNAELARNKK